MEKIRVEEAVGKTLVHDITRVIPGTFKGRAFSRGHVIRPEDVEELKILGKEHVYIWKEGAGEIHEDEAAVRIARAIAGPHIVFTGPQEGKCVLQSMVRGLFIVDSPALQRINEMEHITIPTLPNFYKVEKGGSLAGARIVPLVIRESAISDLEAFCRTNYPLLQVKPYSRLKVGIIVTGNEVFKGRVDDKFAPVIYDKTAYFQAEMLGHTYCPDELGRIEQAIAQQRAEGAELIILTGGMSVDPDDLTPAAIRNSGAEVVTYGVPVQPGNMFMLAYLDGITLIGVPGAAIYYETTILDIVLPRIFAGLRMTRSDFAAMGEGGFCLTCKKCVYPRCYFGR